MTPNSPHERATEGKPARQPVAGARRPTVKLSALAFVSFGMGGMAGACWDYSAADNAAVDGVGGSSSSAASTTSATTMGPTTTASASSTTGGSTQPALPCEVLEGAGLPCVSAHSSVRVIVPGYTGPLYQLERQDAEVLDVVPVDGIAEASQQDTFCDGSFCTISIVYDQSGRGHHLTPAPPGSAKATWGEAAYAEALPVVINGRSAYGMHLIDGQGYRAGCNECQFPEGGPNGTAVGDEPQTIYMVSSQHDLVNGCCFDYGNAEVTANNDGNGTMEAVYLGNGVIWGTGVDGGPWVMADLENGLFAGWEGGQDRNISTNTPLLYDFVTAVVVGDTQDKNNNKGRFALYGGNAQEGVVTTMYDGIRPERPGYVPMNKQGSVILGIGGDNSDNDGGRFYEGVMANGAATKATVDALQAAIVAANYGR